MGCSGAGLPNRPPPDTPNGLADAAPGPAIRAAAHRTQGLGYKGQGTGFGVQGSGHRVRGARVRAQGSGYRGQGRIGVRAQGSESRYNAQGAGFRAQGLGRRNQGYTGGGSGLKVQGPALRATPSGHPMTTGMDYVAVAE